MKRQKTNNSSNIHLEFPGFLRPVAKLCETCEIAFKQWPLQLQLGSVKFDHYGSYTALKSSAEGGCGLCAQFLLGYEEIEPWSEHPDYCDPSEAGNDASEDAKSQDEKPEDARSDTEGIITPTAGILEIRKWGDSSKILLDLRIPYSSDTSLSDNEHDSWSEVELICFNFSVFLSPAAKQALLYDSPWPNTSTMDALPLCKSWLHQCRDSHVACRLQHEQWLPTRLIHIGEGEVRLCRTGELKSITSYVTLSHCWGGLQFMTLTKGNFDTLLKIIQLEALPKSFQEAIYIARYLGFQYIWIDSLCIVQDDPDDWNRESGLMMKVYGHSALNIGASSAKNGTFGCFSGRDKHWRCQIRPTTAAKDTLYDCVPERLLWPHSVPLHKRAWVVQERFMSCRMVHFHKNQVFWSCNHKAACETFPEGYPQHSPPSTEFNLGNGTLVDKWSWIVGHYSSGELTKSSDKLVALGGLPQLYQVETNDRYLCGMWRTNLEEQLCWFVLNTRRRLVPYQAPTWSWASISGSVSLPELKKQEAVILHIQVVDVQVIHATSNNFGQILTASLRLRCEFLCPIMIKHQKHSSEIILGNKSFDAAIWNDCSEIYDDRTRKLSSNIYLLPVKIMKGLLLRATNGKRGSYQRVGVYWIQDQYDGNDNCANFVSAYRSTVCQAGCRDFCEIRDENKDTIHHIIELV